jgi:hypothetical protein
MASRIKTCIICNQRAASHEHVFPAALGGRRTNKGIYCGLHNQGYSPLARILSEQLRLFNAILGVAGDHSEHPHTVQTDDAESGHSLVLSEDRVEFAQPHVVAKTTDGPTSNVTLRFSNPRQKEEWIKAQEALGFKVTQGVEQPGQSYFPSETHIPLLLGGPEGLRAIGYVALTFMAHFFPHFARSSAIDAFKAYTLGSGGAGNVAWDWEPDGLVPNRFEFGHRVVVGFDSSSRTAYARVSLFSALHFAAVLGLSSEPASMSVVVDIDPLAEHPPNDMHVERASSAVGSVPQSTQSSITHADAIRGGVARQSLMNLLQRIGKRHLLKKVASTMLQVVDAELLDEPAREELFASSLARHSQTILNLMRNVVANLKVAHPELPEVISRLEAQVACDPTSIDGLSDLSRAALALARRALTAQMLEDHAHHILNQDRLMSLLAGGPGAAVIGRVLVEPIFSSIRS